MTKENQSGRYASDNKKDSLSLPSKERKSLVPFYQQMEGIIERARHYPNPEGQSWDIEVATNVYLVRTDTQIYIHSLNQEIHEPGSGQATLRQETTPEVTNILSLSENYNKIKPREDIILEFNSYIDESKKAELQQLLLTEPDFFSVLQTRYSFSRDGFCAKTLYPHEVMESSEDDQGYISLQKGELEMIQEVINRFDGYIT